MMVQEKSRSQLIILITAIAVVAGTAVFLQMRSSSPSSSASAQKSSVVQWHAEKESELKLAIADVKRDPSDENLINFLDFSQTWLAARSREIQNPQLGDGNNECDAYVLKHPDLGIISGSFDDVCTLEFEPGFIRRSLEGSLTPAASETLLLLQMTEDADLSFVKNADALLKLEAWMDKNPKIPFFARLNEVYEKALRKTFAGITDGQMPLANYNGDYYPEVKTAWLKLKKESRGKSRNIAEKCLSAMEYDHGRVTQYARDQIESLLE